MPTKTTYINQLSLTIQSQIHQELINLNLSSADIQTALDSRLCDLSDTIDINKYI